MIGQTPTKSDTGEPLDSGGKKLSQSAFVMPEEVKKFYAKFQTDFQTAWLLQRRPFDEFDGYSLLDRAKLDQETFGAFVGVEFQPIHKRWRFRGRKNTARNKLIGILAHLIAGMLFPFVYAQNEKDEEDKLTARVMAILVEEHLRKAGYEIKFMYLVLSALVNPAVFAQIEYVRAIQKIKTTDKNGKINIKEAVDEIMSGTALHIVPIDELLLGDYYSGTGAIQKQPFIFRVRRISYDQARSVYAGKYFDSNGKDLFNYVEAGKTKWIGDDANNTLFDVEWQETDANFVQEVTGYYRSEDLEVTFVGGIPMCNYTDIYNSNPFNHRRLTIVDGEWLSVPIYPFAMSGFEPLDPSGRFAFYKSGAFKEYWEDKKINEIDRMVVDGVKLDVMKPIFLSGVAKFDSTVMVPGATIAMPQNAKMEAYSLGPNLAAAYKTIVDANTDMSESTQDKIMQGTTQQGITATQTMVARQQARIFLGVAGLTIADLVKQIGELTKDCIIQNTTIGALDASIPEALKLKTKVMIARGKEKGKQVTNRIVFSDRNMGKDLSPKEIIRQEWDLYDQAGGENSDQRIYMVDPYRLGRTQFSFFIDADRMVMRSMGTDRQEKELAFEKLSDPRVMPFTDPQAVANDFVIEEYSEGDPDKYKSKKGQEEIMQSLMGLAGTSKPPIKSELPAQTPEV